MNKLLAADLLANGVEVPASKRRDFGTVLPTHPRLAPARAVTVLESSESFQIRKKSPRRYNGFKFNMKKATKTTARKASIPEHELQHISPGLRSLIVPVNSLQQDPRNARNHSSRSIEEITRSMTHFTQLKPIVVRAGTNIVVAGNGTLAAFEAMGWKYIAANVVELTEQQAAAYAIADNRTAELSDWNNERLQEILNELAADEDGYQLADLGFQEGELDDLIGSAAGVAHSHTVKPVDEDAEQSKAGGESNQKWELIVHCTNEDNMRDLLDELGHRGYKATALIGKRK